ncbi:MAG: hypothetical protein WBM61_14375 [Woeseiaceae bacterium]
MVPCARDVHNGAPWSATDRQGLKTPLEAVAREKSSGFVRPVIELGNRSINAFLGRGAYVRLAIDHARYSLY